MKYVCAWFVCSMHLSLVATKLAALVVQGDNLQRVGGICVRVYVVVVVVVVCNVFAFAT